MSPLPDMMELGLEWNGGKSKREEKVPNMGEQFTRPKWDKLQ